MRDLLRRASLIRAQAAIAVSVALVASAAAQQPPLSPSTIAPINKRVLSTTRCGHLYVVEARIDGHGPFTLAIDTGSTVTLINPRVADRLLGESRFSLISPSAQHLGEQCRVKELSVDGIPLNPTPTLVWDMTPALQSSGAEIDGILGYSAFVGKLLILDGPAGQISVADGRLDPVGPDVQPTLPDTDPSGMLDLPRPKTGKALDSPDPKTAKEPRLVGTPSPHVRLTIGGKTFTCTLDTGGAGGFVVPSLDGLDMSRPPVLIGSAATYHGSHPRWAARARDPVQVGNATINGPVVHSFGRWAGVGMEILDQYLVVFDPDSQLVQLTCPHPASVRSPSVRGIGASMDLEAAAWIVRQVTDSSPAAQAGLQPQDRIIAINGKSLSELKCSARLFRDLDVVRFTIDRQGHQLDLAVPVGVLVP